MIKVKIASFIIFSTLLQTNLASACGLSLHIYIGHKAIEMIESPKLKKFLSEHSDDYLSGTTFPDVGYADRSSSKNWGAFSHWSNFINSYARSIFKKCSLKTDSKQCHQAYAHLLGSITHSLSDVNFDKYFVKAVAKKYYNGSLSKAQKFTDWYMDFTLTKQIHLYNLKPKTFNPENFVLSIYKNQGIHLNKSAFKNYLALHSLTKSAIKFIAPIIEIFYSRESKWAYLNYMTAQGGVMDSASVSAKFISKYDALFKKAKSVDQLPVIADKGGWPNKSIWIRESL